MIIGIVIITINILIKKIIIIIIIKRKKQSINNIQKEDESILTPGVKRELWEIKIHTQCSSYGTTAL